PSQCAVRPRALHCFPTRRSSDLTRRLVAYDDITMGGLGLVSVSIHRTQMPTEVPELEVPEGAETPEGTIPPEQEVAPGEGLPDEDRVTPTDPVSPLPSPSDGGEG